MHKKYINIAVIGTGFMGRTHSYSAANIPFFYDNLPFKPVLHSVCSRDKEKGEAVKNDWGFLRTESNIDKILADSEIDVIDICTPNACHFDVILKALEAEKNIYCEKPLVISSEQANKVTEKFKNSKNKSICSVVFNNRFSPAILRAKQLMQEDRLGKIISFRCLYLHNTHIESNKNKSPAGWRQDIDISGGGVLFDLGSHAIDLVRFLLAGENDEIDENNIESVFGTSQIFYQNNKNNKNNQDRQESTDEAFYMTIKLKSGAIGTIESSKLTTGANSDLSIEIYGEKGALKYSLMQPNFLEFYDNTKSGGDFGGDKGFTRIECVQRYPKPGGIFPGAKAPIGWLRMHMHSYYLYLDSVYNGKLSDLLPSFYDGAAVQNIMEKAYLSDKTGTWEKI